MVIIDLKTEKTLYKVPLLNSDLLGRFVSNQYEMEGGHIYYSNSIVKIRYDVLERHAKGHVLHKDHALYEEQAFDYYNNVIKLEDGYDKVQRGNHLPLISAKYNRLAYVMVNRASQGKKPRKLLMLPFLHERKIVLNPRMTENQFYTIYNYKRDMNDAGINVILCLCVSDNKMFIYSETGILIDRI